MVSTAALTPALHRQCLLYALLCALAGFIWQYATVHRNYHGNWTALFCIGELSEFPDLPGENIYRFANSRGFDGQFYYLIAHDPSPRSTVAGSIDTPDLRYQRILVPLLAYAAALGKPRFIASSFILVNLVFLFLGVWWLSKIMAMHGAHPVLGLAFLLIPAVLISLDRMTVDLALVALAAGALYFWDTGQTAKLFVAMTLMCLTRDTGTVVVAGFALYFAIRHEWTRAAISAAAIVPFALWSAYVMALHPLRVAPWTPDHPFAFTWNFLLHGASYSFSLPMSATVRWGVRALDLVAMAGLASGFVAGMVQARRCAPSPATIGNLCFAALGLYLFSLDEWTHVYDFGRVLSPLALNLIVCGGITRRWWLAVPACFMTLRVATQLAPQVLGILSFN